MTGNQLSKPRVELSAAQNIDAAFTSRGIHSAEEAGLQTGVPAREALRQTPDSSSRLGLTLTEEQRAPIDDGLQSQAAQIRAAELAARGNSEFMNRPIGETAVTAQLAGGNA